MEIYCFFPKKSPRKFWCKFPEIFQLTAQLLLLALLVLLSLPVSFPGPSPEHSYVGWEIMQPPLSSGHPESEKCSDKPKFHYADFATKSRTSSQQSREQKSWKSASWIMSPTFTICVRNKSVTLLRTCPRLCCRLSLCSVHCNGLNSIRATQTGLLQTCHGLCRKHLDMLRWFVYATFVICVHDFPCREVSVKVGVMEFGL